MSYELNFYKRKTDTISRADIDNYLGKLPHITSENETQWIYDNEDTGVYCIFEYNKPEEEESEIDNKYIEDFENTYFTFIINFFRPQFFGNECFPLVNKFVEDLDLFISNPLNSYEPKRYDLGELEQDWGLANLSYSKSKFKEIGLNYLELEKSNNSWEFNLHKSKLQNVLGDDYFVPRIFYLKQKNSNTIETMSVWPDNIPYILPEVDYILVQREIKKFFKTINDDGLISYSDLLSQLGQYFKDDKGYKIIHPENANNISKLFNELPLFATLEDFGEVVHVENFVNVQYL